MKKIGQMKERKQGFKNYQFVAVLSRVLQPAFNILFYISVFFILLLMILSLILLFVNMPVDEMLLPPFMHKAEIVSGEIPYSEITADFEGNPAESAEAEGYIITLGNGVKIATLAENVTLGDVKTALYAEITVLIFVLLTVAPIFKFLSALLDNINKKIYLDLKNARYIMFIGLCVSAGTVLIRFMSQFYNYYLLNQFITDASQGISLHLRIDALSGLTGLVIILTGFIYAHVCETTALRLHNSEDAETDTTDIAERL